jgi:hypothetical protein
VVYCINSSEQYGHSTYDLIVNLRGHIYCILAYGRERECEVSKSEVISTVGCYVINLQAEGNYTVFHQRFD